MIKDSLKNADLYAGVHSAFPEIFKFLRTLKDDVTESVDLSLANDTIKGCISVGKTTPAEGKPSESHRKQLDVHFILSGAEDFGYADIDTLNPTCEYNEDGDYVLYNGDIDMIRLNAGDFIVTFPQDGHMPCCAVDGESKPIKRVIFKLDVE